MHRSVFLTQAIDYLQVIPNHWYLDATFGVGGHTREIIKRGGLVFALEYHHDTYQQALINFSSLLSSKKLILLPENFAHLHQLVASHPQFNSDFQFAGCLFDLGTTTNQLMSPTHGLSLYHDGPLDMRLDSNLAVTARDLLMALSAKQLTQLFWEFGGERQAPSLAHAIVKHRHRLGTQAFPSSNSLATFIAKHKKSSGKIHPATKIFQALRIAVNGEIDNLTRALPQAFSLLKNHGRLVVISFHDGEDRPVKHYFRSLALKNLAQIITKKPLQPNVTMLKANPRARSAKLRVLEKN
jgi:16S rRNA (cytosine1402-N4)-methyltransferase